MMTLWFDMETTGLDVDRDAILEVGAVLCDADQRIIETYTKPVMPPGGVQAAHDGCADEVRDMHWRSGLWRDVMTDGRPLDRVVDQLYGMLHRNRATIEPLVLAGSGVAHFDRRLIRRHMPHIEHHLYYKERDVSAVRWLLEDAGVTMQPRQPGDPEYPITPHRALSDALDARYQWLWASAHVRVGSAS